MLLSDQLKSFLKFFRRYFQLCLLGVLDRFAVQCSCFKWKQFSISNNLFDLISFKSKFKFCVFFQFLQSHPKIDAAILFATIFYACYAFGMVFMICELGQRISNAFEEIDDVIAQFNWYLFSDELKRMLPIILMNTQAPVVFECFGSISCSREAFKKVRETKIQFNQICFFSSKLMCFRLPTADFHTLWCFVNSVNCLVILIQNIGH